MISAAQESKIATSVPRCRRKYGSDLEGIAVAMALAGADRGLGSWFSRFKNCEGLSRIAFLDGNGVVMLGKIVRRRAACGSSPCCAD